MRSMREKRNAEILKLGRKAIKACQNLSEFIEKYQCHLIYKKSGKDANTEDGALVEINAIAEAGDNLGLK